MTVESFDNAVTWSNRLGLTLTPITTGVWAAERPFIWNNIDVGGRSVIARMKDGSLFVHSPVEWDEDLGDAIDQLGGDIKHIVSPNYEHLKYAQQWNDIYPNAYMWACPGLIDKMPTVKWTDEISKNVPIEFDDSIDVCWFDCESFINKPFFNEIVFHHKSSSSFICSDSWWNYPQSSLPNYHQENMNINLHQCSKVSIDYNTIKELPPVDVPFGTTAWKFGMDKIYAPFYNNIMVGGDNSENRLKYNDAVNQILNWNCETLIPCHGDIVRGKNLSEKVLSSHFFGV